MLKFAVCGGFNMRLVLEWITCAYETVRRLALQGKGSGASRLKGMRLDPVGLGLPLENLRRVELRHQDPVSFDWVPLFFALPSLREFQGHLIAMSKRRALYCPCNPDRYSPCLPDEDCYNNQDRNGPCHPGRYCPCNLGQYCPCNPGRVRGPDKGRFGVKELAFGWSAINTDAWCSVLDGMDALEKFEYHCGGRTVSPSRWDCHELIHGLEINAKETLRDLKLWRSEVLMVSSEIEFLRSVL